MIDCMSHSVQSKSNEPRSGVTIDLAMPPAQILFQHLLTSSVVIEEDWDRLLPQIREELTALSKPGKLLPKLTEYGLLTEYQAGRIEAGTTSGLVMGNYRILERIGAGGMGVVFKAEHIDLRRPVAIKVLALSSQSDPRILGRFLSEMRAVARLQHPNIVAAIDAGKCESPGPDSPELRYFVMEFVPGQDLEEHVKEHGPLGPTQACDVIHQIASALAEAHEHQLVHRDIKPSNIRLTPEGQAKLLDFGLALNWNNRITQPGTMLGTMEYMAPEQASDAGSVDIRADLYGLGGTLYWCLTGQPPFPPRGSLAEQIARRLTQPPPSPRLLRADLPIELDRIVTRMLAREPAERFANPRAVMNALVPFLNPEAHSSSAVLRQPIGSQSSASFTSEKSHRLLIIDDDAQLREFTRFALQIENVHCDEASNGEDGLRMVRAAIYDLVLLDIDMPGMNGHQVCQRLREDPPSPHLKIIMFSGRASPDEMAQIMNDGADDFLSKPFSVVQLQARVKAALRLKMAQQRAEVLNEHLLSVNRNLEAHITAKDADFSASRKVLVLALAELVAARNETSPAHLTRMQQYCRRLAGAAAQSDSYRRHIDDHFIDMLVCCVPLHNIGYSNLPDALLKKPDRLTTEERLFMETHTVQGADILLKVARKHGVVGGFLQTALDVIRHHHERYDGQGYPDRLAGEAIPLAARIVAICDVYDALRSRRPHKPPLSHATALEVIVNQCRGQFDPHLLQALTGCAADFERIFRDN